MEIDRMLRFVIKIRMTIKSLNFLYFKFNYLKLLFYLLLLILLKQLLNILTLTSKKLKTWSLKKMIIKKWSLARLNKILQKIDETGSIERKVVSGKKKT